MANFTSVIVILFWIESLIYRSIKNYYNNMANFTWNLGAQTQNHGTQSANFNEILDSVSFGTASVESAPHGTYSLNLPGFFGTQSK